MKHDSYWMSNFNEIKEAEKKEKEKNFGVLSRNAFTFQVNKFHERL